MILDLSSKQPYSQENFSKKMNGSVELFRLQNLTIKEQ